LLESAMSMPSGAQSRIAPVQRLAFPLSRCFKHIGSQGLQNASCATRIRGLPYGQSAGPGDGGLATVRPDAPSQSNRGQSEARRYTFSARSAEIIAWNTAGCNQKNTIPFHILSRRRLVATVSRSRSYHGCREAVGQLHALPAEALRKVDAQFIRSPGTARETPRSIRWPPS